MNTLVKAVVKGNKKPCLIVCHGDSVTEYTNGYVGYVKIAAQSAAPVNATVVNEGHASQSIGYLLANLQTQVLSRNPDIVTLCILLNELGNSNIGASITTYVNNVLSHTNPNGKKPVILLITDNFCGQNIGEPFERLATTQDATHTNIINAYTTLAANNPNVFFCDPYATFRALGVDTPELYAVLDGVRVHPNDAGGKLMINAMQQGIFQSVFKFYNS